MRSTLTGIKGVVFVVTLVFLHDLVRGDAEVTCVLMESCILPCTFPSGNDVVIHWIHVTANNTYVHSYYHDEDQFKTQGQRFRNRTSLFKEQISGGNASLRLTRVETGDQGKYKCYTSCPGEPRTTTTTFVNLKVEDAALVTATSGLLSSSFPTQRSVDEDQDISDNEDNKNTKIVIGVVSGILGLGLIGGLTGFCLRRHRPKNPPNQRARGGQQRATPKHESVQLIQIQNQNQQTEEQNDT